MMLKTFFRALVVAVLLSIAAVGAIAQQHRGDWWGYGPMGPRHMRPDHMPGWGWGKMGPGQQQRMQRHWTYMNEGVPPTYRGARSTVRATTEIVKEGEALYADRCARCHGAEGLGDGEAGRSLVPSPALLQWFVQMPMAGDEYLLWAISEGGERFGTDMPAFKEDLTEEEIWRIVAYMRARFR